MPSFKSSPWIRGAPHSGLSCTIFRISARTSAPTGGRPVRRRLFHFQNRRNGVPRILVDTSSARLVSRLELLGTQSVKMTVATRSIVKRLNIVGHIGLRQLRILLDLFLDPLFLQASAD